MCGGGAWFLPRSAHGAGDLIRGSVGRDGGALKVFRKCAVISLGAGDAGHLMKTGVNCDVSVSNHKRGFPLP